MEEKPGQSDGVHVTMELTGEYEEVVTRLQMTESRSDLLEPMLSEIDALLDTLAEMNGGTRSAIAEQLPSEMAIVEDGKVVASVLNVLERFGLIDLEGNTWKPGPQL